MFLTQEQDFDSWIMSLPTVQENRSKAKILDNLYHYFDRFWDFDRQYVLTYLSFNEKSSPHIRDEIHHVLQENDKNTQDFERFLEGLSDQSKENILSKTQSQLLTFEEVLVTRGEQPAFVYFLIKGTLDASLGPDGPKQRLAEGALVGVGNIFGTRSLFDYVVSSKFAFIMKIHWTDLMLGVRDENPQNLQDFFEKISAQYLQEKDNKAELRLAAVPDSNMNRYLGQIQGRFKRIVQPVKLLKGFRHSSAQKLVELHKDSQNILFNKEEGIIGQPSKSTGTPLTKKGKAVNWMLSPFGKSSGLGIGLVRNSDDDKKKSDEQSDCHINAAPPDLENLTDVLMKLFFETKQRGKDEMAPGAALSLEFARMQIKRSVMFSDFAEQIFDLFQLEDKPKESPKSKSQASSPKAREDQKNNDEPTIINSTFNMHILEESDDDQHLVHLYHADGISIDKLGESVNIGQVEVI